MAERSNLRYMRLEALASPLLRPGVDAEIGLGFSCTCGALHLGLPLPVRRCTGRRWTTVEAAVQVVGVLAPALEKPPCMAGSRRGGRRDPVSSRHGIGSILFLGNGKRCVTCDTLVLVLIFLSTLSLRRVSACNPTHASTRRYIYCHGRATFMTFDMVSCISFMYFLTPREGRVCRSCPSSDCRWYRQ